MRNKIVTLLRPPIISSVSSFSIPVTPPIALAYLTAVLEKSGIEVDPIDAIGEDIENIEIKSRGRKAQGMSFQNIVKRIHPNTDILAISIMFSQEWPLIRDLIDLIKSKHPHLTVIAGGEHITAMPEFSLKDCAGLDYCGLGEGEELLLDFINAFRNKDGVKNVSGLCYRDGNRFVKTPSRERIKNVSSLPWPAWDRLPIEVYLSSGYGNGISSGRNMPIIATRGCPFQCTFCSNPIMWEQRYLMRAPIDVLNEIKYYVKKYNVSHIEFYDLTAIIRKQWIIDFCNLYLQGNLHVSWSLPTGTRSEALDEDVLTLLYKTNCHYLVYAPESGSPKTLKEIKKQVHLNHLLYSLKKAINYGINTRCNLIIGFPKEDIKEILKTLLFQIKLAWLGVDDAPIYMFSPYPGSSLFEYLRQTKRISEINDDYFDTLLAQMDLKVSQTYCENVSGRTLRFLRVMGMCLFYGLTYLLKPRRFLRSINNIFFRKLTNTVFEQRILEMLKRSTKMKRETDSICDEVLTAH